MEVSLSDIYEMGELVGIKKVVEWLGNHGGVMEFINMHYDEEWQAQLKDWGVAIDK